MNSMSCTLRLALLMVAPLLSHCTTVGRQTAGNPSATVREQSSHSAPQSGAATKAAGDDDLDEYAVVEIADPMERFNRGSFWLNDKLYAVLLRPISRTYEFILPQRVRTGIDNVFVNAKYPVRLVNHTLQGRFKNAGLETEKFLLNTVVGVGGAFRISDKFTSLAGLPEPDTGMTFAKWGMGHGPYLVLPVLGPSSVRDGIGLAADSALNPVNWGLFWGGAQEWTDIPSYINMVRILPSNLELYDEAKKSALDPYLSVRSAYVQYREELGKK